MDPVVNFVPVRKTTGCIIKNFGPRNQFPLRKVNFRKINISLKSLMDTGEVEAVGKGQKLPVERGSPNDEIFVGGVAFFNGAGNGIGHFAPFDPFVWDIGDHDVCAVGKRPVGQGFTGTFSHDDGMAAGNLPKPFEVIGQMP